MTDVLKDFDRKTLGNRNLLGRFTWSAIYATIDKRSDNLNNDVYCKHWTVPEIVECVCVCVLRCFTVLVFDNVWDMFLLACSGNKLIYATPVSITSTSSQNGLCCEVYDRRCPSRLVRY